MSGGRYWVKRLDELPLVPTDDPNDFDWYPVQHHLGLGAFGVNGFGGDTAPVQFPARGAHLSVPKGRPEGPTAPPRGAASDVVVVVASVGAHHFTGRIIPALKRRSGRCVTVRPFFDA